MNDDPTPESGSEIPDARVREFVARFRDLASGELDRRRLGRLLLAIEDQEAADAEVELRDESERLGPSDGKMLRALEQVLVSWRDWTLRDVVGRIKAVMANLGQRHSAGTSWLAVAGRGGTFSALVTQAEKEEGLTREIDVSGPGIVPRVLRTLTAYATGNTRANPYYSRFFASTRSEQAVPVSYGTGLGNKLHRAVVNQESRAPFLYHAVSAETLRQEAGAKLAPLLSEWDVLNEPGFPCTWNPRRHGWGIHDYLETLLQQVKEQLDPAPQEEKCQRP